VKKHILVPIALFALSIVFVTVCLLVWLSRGRSNRLIAIKLKIGAILLTLTTTFTTMGCIGPVMCYVSTGLSIAIDQDDLSSDGTIYMDLTSDNILNGTVSNYFSSMPSYAIMERNSDSSDDVLQSGNISAIDGSSDTDEKAFEITVNDLTPDSYDFRIFYSKIEDVNNFSWYCCKWTLIIQ
jgi:hypothetical protein